MIYKWEVDIRVYIRCRTCEVYRRRQKEGDPKVAWILDVQDQIPPEADVRPAGRLAPLFRDEPTPIDDKELACDFHVIP